MKTLNYTMNRIAKGSKTYFYPTLNGKRFNNTNYARKYDAKGLVKLLINTYGVDFILNKMEA